MTLFGSKPRSRKLTQDSGYYCLSDRKAFLVHWLRGLLTAMTE